MNRILALSLAALTFFYTVRSLAGPLKVLWSPQTQVLAAQRQRFVAMTKLDRAALQMRLSDQDHPPPKAK
jgi:hypothetical protein